MTAEYSRMRPRKALLCWALCTLASPWSAVYASKVVHETAAVDPQAPIEIVQVAGALELLGWDKPQIDVSGKVADNVERVDITTHGMRSDVRVVTRDGAGWGDSDGTRLTIHVPRKSAVTAILVATSLQVDKLQGDLKVQTVSGALSGEVGGDLRVTAVSGNVKLKAPTAHRIEVKTISGDIELGGGGDEADISTVSGDAQLELGTLGRARFKSVSGDLSVHANLAPAVQIEAESVSGTLRFTFAAVPDADVDIQSFSGEIDNCFGPKPMKSSYGPGSRLSFKSGAGGGRVRIETKNGDVRICTK